MRSKAILSVLICLALLLSFGIAVKEAKADAILFPWIAKGTGVSTLVSVVNTADTSSLHYRYYYKAYTGTAADLASTCTDHDKYRPSSQYDSVVFDAALNINSGKALYSDGAASTDSPYYQNLVFGLPATGDNRALLIVSNGVATNNTIYGEAVILELSQGAAWGYDAYNSTDYDDTAIDFSNAVEVYGEVIGSSDYKPVVLWPTADFTTKFFVTPVYTDHKSSSAVKLAVNVRLTDSSGNIGIYGDNENWTSHSAKPKVVCTGVLALTDLISGATYNEWVTNGGQAWAYINALEPTADDPNLLVEVSEAVIGKLEYTTASIDLEGKTVPGAVNNFIWIRK